MKVSRAFLRDFAYLANYYRWEQADILEMKAALRANEAHGRSYVTRLATAHRAGYVQNAGNGYLRMEDWWALRGGYG